MSTPSTQHSHYIFVIENTGNADFLERGRINAIVDMLRGHSDVIYGWEAVDRFEASNLGLFDGNGNRIGYFRTATLDQGIDNFIKTASANSAASQPFVLTFDMSNAAFRENGYSYEIAYVLRQAADRMEQAFDEIHVNDSNGNQIGRYAFHASLSPVNEDEEKITNVAFDSTIYKIDSSLIQDHAMYVVAQGDYELGYNETGRGYLFAANGEVADVVEINDNLITKLDKAELDSLEKCFWADDPSVTDAHERQYWPDYEPSDDLSM